MTAATSPKRPLLHVYRVPLGLGALTLLGLLAALLSDGWLVRQVACLAVALPLLVIGRHAWRARHR